MRKLVPFLALVACGPSSSLPPAPPEKVEAVVTSSAEAPPAAPTGYGRLTRATFNRLANRMNAPVYWAGDDNKNGVIDPAEVAALEFYPTRGEWVASGAFTKSFSDLYEQMVAAEKAPLADDRRARLAGELDEAASVLVRTRTANFTAEDRAFLSKMQIVAARLDELYEEQNGSLKLRDKVPSDPESQSVFRRNRGPQCLTPKYENDPACSAIPGAKPMVDVWPESLQGDKDFCKTIEKAKNADELMSHFSVVREKKGGGYVAVPYNEAYGPRMKAVSDALLAAAAELKSPSEKPLVDYLKAASTAFLTNKWEPADEAWAKMNARNSSWYLRIGPDETYWEPCSEKAGFHMSFARINRDSLKLQDQLTPLQQKMEDDLAALIGAPYKARKVTFHLPDFIDIVVNAGDSRDAIGGTIGQSLPNWGIVADKGRGRTVAMTNLYEDPDSIAVRTRKAESLLDAETLTHFAGAGGPGLLGTVLHEATHNLGPSHDYKVGGKKDGQVFGGDLASMLEELKAQSGAYFYLELLREKGIIDQKTLEQTVVDNIVWSMNHISRGMYTAGGNRKAYSQLAAIHVGFLMEEGVLEWKPDALAANGKDKGAFHIHFDKFQPASVKLMKLVGGIKGKGDKDGALKLANQHVEAGSKVPHALIKERMLRFPQPNFVYAIEP